MEKVNTTIAICQSFLLSNFCGITCDCAILNNVTPISIPVPYLRLPVVSWAIGKGWPLTRQNLERLKRTFQFGWTMSLVWATNNSCLSVALMAGVTTIVSIVKMLVLFALVRMPATCNNAIL